MAKPRQPAVDSANYLAVRLTVCLLQALPPNVARSFAGGLAWLAYRIDKRHREVARENLRHAFPGRYSEMQIDGLVRAVYRHFCTVLVEIAQFPRKLHVANWRDTIDLVDGSRCVALLTSGRPVLAVTGHFGNWELVGYMMGVLGFRSWAVARRLDNPHLDAFLRRFRQGTGQTILDKSTDYQAIQNVLANGGTLGMLADQDAGPRGLFVDFFSRPASTFKSIAILALEYQAPIMVIGVPKIGQPRRYRLIVEDIIEPAEYADRRDAAAVITQRYTAALERLVRQHPEQYFWLHRRWKHQPPVRKVKAA